MIKFQIAITLAICVGLSQLAAMVPAAPGQDWPPSARRAPDQTLPPGITLIPGYQHERYQTVDSIHGRIWMDQRLDIRYDWGFGVRNRIRDESSTLLWSREQVLDRNRVQIAMTRNRVLLITFNAPATGNTVSITHFSAVTDSDEDIADMLLMVLTFRAQRP